MEYYPEIEDVSWANTRGSLAVGCYIEVVAQVKTVQNAPQLHAWVVRVRAAAGVGGGLCVGVRPLARMCAAAQPLCAGARACAL